VTGTEVPNRPSVAATASEIERNNARDCHQESGEVQEGALCRACTRKGAYGLRLAQCLLCPWQRTRSGHSGKSGLGQKRTSKLQIEVSVVRSRPWAAFPSTT